MNAKIIRGITALVKILSALAALGAHPEINYLPQKYLLPALIVLGVASALKDFLISLGDYLDDGKKNGSFDVSKLSLLALLACCVALVGCEVMKQVAATPMVQASLTTAKTLGKQLVAAEETAVIEQIILTATARLALLQGSTVFVDQLEAAELQVIIASAQTKYQGLTGRRFEKSKGVSEK